MDVLLFIQRWWRSIDRLILSAAFCLFIFGLLLNLSYSHALTHRLVSQSTSLFTHKHTLCFITAIIVMLVLSGLPIRALHKACYTIAITSTILVLYSILYGTTFKGGTRWVTFGMLSLQPSEIFRATYPMITSILLTRITSPKLQIIASSIPLLGIATLLLMQPDIGMIFLMCSTYIVQLFITLRNIWVIAGITVVPVICVLTAIITSPHARARIYAFLSPANTSDSYQIALSTKCFQSGGMLGVGPGNGLIKYHLPDMHSDFIFATMGEELGALFCVLVLALYTFIVLRTLYTCLGTRDQYTILICAGYATHIAAQTLLNTASVLNLIPPKGTTLPCISYGGSSLLSIAWVIGSILNTSRHHIHPRTPLGTQFMH